MTDTARILIVEDIPACLEEFRLLLEDASIPHELVTDRLSAQDKLRKAKYSLLMLDIRLDTETEEGVDPQTSGVTLLTDLRSGRCGELNKNIVVLVLTAYPELKIEDKLVGDLGAKLFLSKPKVDKDLFATVGELLRNQQDGRN